MTEREREDAAYMELTPDAWHQSDGGNYYIDCPECGSAASLMNVVTHGRCNGYLDQREGETDLDEESMNCTAKLWFELGYRSDPDETMTDESTGESASEDPIASGNESPGIDGTVDDAGPENERDDDPTNGSTPQPGTTEDVEDSSDGH